MSLTASIARAAAQMLAPLEIALEGPDQFAGLLSELGVHVSVTADDFAAVVAFIPIASELEEIAVLSANLAESEVVSPDVIATVLSLSQAVLTSVNGLAALSASSISALADPLDKIATWAYIVEALPGHLLSTWLRLEHALAFALIDLAGGTSPLSDDGLPERRSLDWGRVGSFVGDPAGHFTETYGWGSAFDHARLIAAVGSVLRASGVDALLAAVPDPIRDDWFNEASVDVAALRTSLWSGASSGAAAAFGLLLVPVPTDSGQAPTGLLLTNESVGTVGVTMPLSDGVDLIIGGAIEATGSLGILIAPDGTSLASNDAAIEGRLSIVAAPDTPWMILGGPTGTRVELHDVTGAVELSGTTSDPVVEFGVSTGRGLALIVEAEDGDSFISAILGGHSIIVETEFAASWRSDEGISIGGTIGFTTVIPLDLPIGPVTVTALEISIGADGEQMGASILVAASASLGPIAIAVDGIGVSATLQRRSDGLGILGDADLNLNFKPPDGVGVGLDVGVASGGGYLNIDADAGSYEGVLDLEVLGVGISAVAIIDTKLPDVDGWSMFFALFLDLPSIQLGFGFTLNGVGGVAGINRGIDVDALGSAVRSGSLDTILFPEDPIADAPIIIEEFRSIFPPADGSYVFGPIVKLGWGTPPLIEAELGIVIQLPDPLVIVVLGSLSAVLPTEEAALVELHLDVAGAIDFEAGTVSIDASLHDSHVVGFALSGDMALRAEFGNAQAFLMSVGGFHPRFDPPGDFPSLRRVTFGISAGSLLRIDFEAYFALTSNSVQCGARFTLDADVLGFGVYGSSGFDALIQFSPFMVITSVDFEVSITAAGVDLMGVMLYASVEGPNRWHVIGTARFEVLGIGKDIRVDETIGAKENEPPVAAAEVLEELISTLETEDAWTVIQVNDPAVTLTEITDPTAPMFANPDALIEVRQRLVPLGVDIERFGDAPVGDHSLFDFVTTDGEQTATLEDWFAPGYYFPLSKDDKLEGPEFELMRSGIQFGGAGAIAGSDVPTDTGYKAFILDPEFPDEETPAGFTSVLAGVAGVSATATTSGGFTAVQNYSVGTTAPTYVVVDDGGKAVGSEHLTTWAEAYSQRGANTDLHIERELTEVSA